MGCKALSERADDLARWFSKRISDSWECGQHPKLTFMSIEEGKKIADLLFDLSVELKEVEHGI